MSHFDDDEDGFMDDDDMDEGPIYWADNECSEIEWKSQTQLNWPQAGISLAEMQVEVYTVRDHKNHRVSGYVESTEQKTLKQRTTIPLRPTHFNALLSVGWHKDSFISCPSLIKRVGIDLDTF